MVALLARGSSLHQAGMRAFEKINRDAVVTGGKGGRRRHPQGAARRANASAKSDVISRR
jgi:hypothetical protein